MVAQRTLTRGAIEYVRELPLRAFPGVESRFYIIVFRRDSRIGSTVLCNHDVEGKHRIVVSRAEIITHDRLDFAYFESKKIVESVRTELTPLGLLLERLPLFREDKLPHLTQLDGAYIPPTFLMGSGVATRDIESQEINIQKIFESMRVIC